MKIEKKQLIDSLEIARMGIAGSDHLEQLGHFIFGGEYLTTFNNRILIYHPLNTDFQCSVRAELFYKQLQKFDTEELEITLKKSKITIKGVKERASLTVELEKDSEIFEIIRAIREEQLNTEYIDVPEDFVKAIEFCSYSASKNAADGTLCCVCIHGKKLVSTDNYRATRYIMDKEMTKEKVLLDARVANEIKRFNMTQFGVGNNWLHFKNKKGVLLSARQIFGDYPDISEAFNVTGERMELPVDTIKILDFVSVLLSDDQPLEKKATIEIKDGFINAYVDKTTESAEKAIKLDDRYKDLDMKFMIHIDFLKGVLSKTRMMVYNLTEMKGMFRSGHLKHVIRLSEEKEKESETKDVSVETTGEEMQPESPPCDDDIPF